MGVVIRILLHLVETTEQKRLDARFAQSPKMQADGQHAGGIANDFNNLLTAMIGFCDLLLKRCRPGEQVFGDVMQIKQNANRDTSLVRQLLAFSRQQTLAPQCLQKAKVISAARDGAPDIPVISISDYTQGSVDHIPVDREPFISGKAVQFEAVAQNGE